MPFKLPFKLNCQAQVQVPNPLSQQAPNPDPKFRSSLKSPKTQLLELGPRHVFRYRVTNSKPNFLLEDFENNPIFVTSAILGGS